MNILITLFLSSLIFSPASIPNWFQTHLPLQEEKVYDIDEYDIPSPELVHRVDPRYPEKAQKAKIPGAFIIAEIVIDKEGNVSEVKVLTVVSLHYHDQLKAYYGSSADLKQVVKGSPHFTEDTYDFAKTSVEAIKKWRYKPSIYNGAAVPVRALVGIRSEVFSVPM